MQFKVTRLPWIQSGTKKNSFKDPEQILPTKDDGKAEPSSAMHTFVFAQTETKSNNEHNARVIKELTILFDLKPAPLPR